MDSNQKVCVCVVIEWEKLCFQMSSEPDLSFYGVYDGHAGKDAAAFAASHVHGLILESDHYPDRPIEAIQEAFRKADQVFLDKGKNEVCN